MLAEQPKMAERGKMTPNLGSIESIGSRDTDDKNGLFLRSCLHEDSKRRWKMKLKVQLRLDTLCLNIGASFPLLPKETKEHNCGSDFETHTLSSFYPMITSSLLLSIMSAVTAS